MDTLEGARHLGHLIRLNLDTLHSWSTLEGALDTIGG